MIIKTSSVEDFLVNLDAGSVYQGRVWYERTSRPMDNRSRLDAHRFQVFYQLSAIIEDKDGGQALLICGVDCGTDVVTADEDMGGSTERDRLHEVVRERCSSKGLQLLPGVLDR